MAKLTQTEARDAIVQGIVSKYRAEDGEPTFTILDMQMAVEEAVSQIQKRLAPKLDQFANTLWSNENGGTAGKISKLRTDAHELIAVADEIVGTYRN